MSPVKSCKSCIKQHEISTLNQAWQDMKDTNDKNSERHHNALKSFQITMEQFKEEVGGFIKWGIGIIVTLLIFIIGSGFTVIPNLSNRVTALEVTVDTVLNGTCAIKGNRDKLEYYVVGYDKQWDSTSTELCFESTEDAESIGYKKPNNLPSNIKK